MIVSMRFRRQFISKHAIRENIAIHLPRLYRFIEYESNISINEQNGAYKFEKQNRTSMQLINSDCIG
jgi:hypothetical protein